MNTNDPNSQKHENDLDWLAFLYVADELSAEEKSSFEERLADDPQACAAVAQAIEISQLVCQAAEQGIDESGKTIRPANPTIHLVMEKI